jgi:pyruvate/2-oxoglutarate dehydrogenase complex dihydrolipoamide acyltransferase (E2) component
MILRLKMPRLAISMEQGTLAQWLVEDGHPVEKDQPIYVVESEKTANEITSPMRGTLKHVAKLEGIYKVGEIIAELEVST